MIVSRVACNTQNFKWQFSSDEYGGMAGLVTLEDPLLWRRLLVDDDETVDKAEIEVHEIGENTYIVIGTTPLTTLMNTGS